MVYVQYFVAYWISTNAAGIATSIYNPYMRLPWTTDGIGLSRLAEMAVMLLDLTGGGVAQLLGDEDQGNASVDQG